MTKKELIEMLSDVPDNSVIRIVETRQDLLGSSTYSREINGYYENNGYYVLCGLNVRPYKVVEKHD
jgi:hypothetical protein